MSRDEIEKKFNKGFKTKYIAIKRMSTKSNIKIKYIGMKLKKKLNKGLKTKYIILKRMRI
jgi:hypothetical protein